MHRGWQDNPIFDREEFSRRDAWIWLIENAAWKTSRARVKGETIELNRGELCFAQRFLAEKWGWSKSRVDRFLKILDAEGMIEVRSKNGATANHAAGQGQSIITICNYDIYQRMDGVDRGNDDPHSGATAGQQRTKEENNKQERKNISSVSKDTSDNARAGKNEKSVDAFPRPDFCPPAVWNDFLINRKAKRLPNTATAHKRMMNDLARLSDPEWPPGRLIEFAAARGWGGIYDPRNRDTSRPSQEKPNGHIPTGMGRTEAAARLALDRIAQAQGRSPPSQSAPGYDGNDFGRVGALPHALRGIGYDDG